MARIRGFITRETLREPQGSTVNRCRLSEQDIQDVQDVQDEEVFGYLEALS